MLEGARRARPDPRARQDTDVTTRATEAMGMVVGFAHRHEHVLAARYTNAKGTALGAAAMVPTLWQGLRNMRFLCTLRFHVCLF